MFPDKCGKPDAEMKEKPKAAVFDEFKCGECESPLIKGPPKKGKGFWWGVSGFPACKQSYFGNNGVLKYPDERYF
jgi:ssDNA-binding Zn-finger/Zn-ribbon topoisomerase 1